MREINSTGFSIANETCSGAKSLDKVNASSIFPTTHITPWFSIDSLAMTDLSIIGTRRSISSWMASAILGSSVIKTARASGSCSACAIKSAAHSVGLALESAITTVSVGP